MDDEEYRRLCAAPNVMARRDLRATEVRLRGRRPDLADAVAAVLRSVPVAKPPKHDGGVEADYLWIDLAADQIEEIHEALREQETSLVQDGEPYQPELSFVADLADRWNEAESSRADTV